MGYEIGRACRSAIYYRYQRNPDKSSGSKRESVRSVRSTRRSWGHWRSRRFPRARRSKWGPGGGPGGRPGGGGVDLDPLVLENNESRPLASKLLAVPELRARYLSYVRDIAENWLDWEKAGPRILKYRALIEEDVAVDTRKLFSTEEFYAGIDNGGGTEERSLRG